MADWTDVILAPFGVSYFNSYCGIHSVGAAMGSLGTPASTAYPAISRAIFIPFRLIAPTRITQLWLYNGATVSGNLDLGIYDAGGVSLGSIGSTAQAGVSVMQIVSLAAAIRLGVGLFYTAISIDNTTATVYQGGLAAALGIARSKIVGMAQQASVFPLPATATFATITSTYLPVIGFISEEG